MTDLTHILNWRRLSDRITTSGQPSEAELSEIKALGVTEIINLGPHGNKGALADEAGTVANLGMTYHYIPVRFQNPTDADYEAFREALKTTDPAKVHVHCIYNARVSAFFYRYAKRDSGLPIEFAFDNMESIWRPGSDWARFIDDKNAFGQLNRYKGEDY